MFENIKRMFSGKEETPEERKSPGYMIEEKGVVDGLPAASVFSSGATGSTTKYVGAGPLLAAYRTSPWLRAVVSKICYHTSKVPLVLYEAKLPRGQKERGRNHIKLLRYKAETDPRQKARLEEQLISDGILEVVTEHPLLDLLRYPNEGMGGMGARQWSQGNIELTGQVFWRLFMSGEGKNAVPESFVPYPVTWLRETPTANKPFYTFNIGDKKDDVVPQDQVIVFRDLNLEHPNGRGTGLGETLGDEIETDEMAARYTRGFFSNSARPDMLVSVVGESNPEALRRLQRAIENQHRGWGRSFRPLFTNKEVDVKVLTQKFSDLQMTDIRNMSRDMIIQVWGVPPEILGILQSSNRATIRESRGIFNDEVIVPRMDMFVDTLNTQLVPFYDKAEGKSYYLGYVAPSREDKEERMAAMQAQPHTATVAEWRASQGLEVREGDDIHMVPLGIQAVEDLGSVEAPEAQEGAQDTSEEDSEKAAKGGTPGPFVVREPRLQVVDSSLEALRPDRLTAEAMPVWVEEMPVWAQAALLDIGSDAAFDMLNPLVAGHLRDFAGDRIVGINDTTKEQIRKTLVEGVQAGEGANQLAARVRSEFEGITTGRARTIARTETGNSANFATVEAYRQSGIVDRIQWVATLDGRTRDAHAMLDGDIVKLGDPFTSPVSGAQSFRPNGFGLAEEDINCRCTTTAVIEDPKSADELRIIWKGYVEDIETWETAAYEAFVRGFKQQEQDLLRAIERIF